MTEQHEQAHAPVSPKVYVAVYITILESSRSWDGE